MRAIVKKPWFVFLVSFLGITLPLCLFPINLFQGEIVLEIGLVQIIEQRPLSLSYFFGLGYDQSDMVGIKDFYLLPQGYILALLFTFGIPGLIALRVHYRK